MQMEFDITPGVRQQSAIPFERMRVVRQFDELSLAQIRRGIVYFFAGWSGLSLHYFHRVTKVLTFFMDTNLEIYVVDIDSVPRDFMMNTFGHSHPAGNGETIWVRDGYITSTADMDLDSQFETEVSQRSKTLLIGNNL